MASSNPMLSAMFYASAVLLGKYLLLNLLVAILVENYSFVQSEEVRGTETAFTYDRAEQNKRGPDTEYTVIER